MNASHRNFALGSAIASAFIISALASVSASASPTSYIPCELGQKLNDYHGCGFNVPFLSTQTGRDGYIAETRVGNGLWAPHDQAEYEQQGKNQDGSIVING